MAEYVRRMMGALGRLIERVETNISSAWCRNIAAVKGIKVGRETIFVGCAHFSRVPGSMIKVKDHCRMRSDRYSNRVGLNRACFLSTLRPKAVLKIGSHCAFSGTVIAAACHVELGDFVRCGANSTIMDTDFHQDDPRSGEPKPVHIEDHVWLGLNVIVQKGVRIGRNSVIASGSVVAKDIPPNVVAGGVPARVVKVFSEETIRKTEAFFCEQSRKDARPCVSA